MQLNMITPMDIGLERQDGVDDSDMFDLGEVEGGVELSRRSLKQLNKVKEQLQEALGP